MVSHHDSANPYQKQHETTSVTESRLCIFYCDTLLVEQL